MRQLFLYRDTVRLYLPAVVVAPFIRAIKEVALHFSGKEFFYALGITFLNDLAFDFQGRRKAVVALRPFFGKELVAFDFFVIAEKFVELFHFLLKTLHNFGTDNGLLVCCVRNVAALTPGFEVCKVGYDQRCCKLLVFTQHNHVFDQGGLRKLRFDGLGVYVLPE